MGRPSRTGWGAAADGTPTTDPREAIEGLILPVGGAKGYVMAFMFDVLAGVLTGSAFGADVVGPYRPEGASGAGHLLITLDVAAFADREDYDARVAALAEQVRGSEPAAWSDGVLTPGELEDRNRRRAEADGIRVSDQTWAELTTLADATGVALPETTAPEGDRMISLVVRLDVVPDRREEFLAAITAQRRLDVRRRARLPPVRRLPGSQSDPHHFVLYEIYRDEAALEAHRAAPHFARWREAVARTVVPGSQVNTITELVIAHRETDTPQEAPA